MRYLILSDIHANWEALAAVLEQAAGRYDAVVACGDLVDYGADPNAVVDWARTHVSVMVRGNHDKACAGLEDLEWFNPAAKASAGWTQAALTPDNRSYLAAMPRGPLEAGGFQVMHGSPMNEDEYLISLAEAAQAGMYLEASLSVFGHTHLQGGFVFHRRRVKRIPKTPANRGHAELYLEPDLTYLVNPGSIGQPRDHDPRSAYLIYSSEERLVTFHRAAYDVGGAQAKILRAGLPEPLAVRLALGA